MPILLSHDPTTENFLRQSDDENQDPNRTFEELCKPWREDGRTAEEIIQDIYESRTVGRERECDYHVHFS